MSDFKANYEQINLDAWSDGQIRSKLWLCEALERDFTLIPEPLNIWIFGSWYGLLAQFLLIRHRLPVKKFRLFDIDPEALRISEKMLLPWILQGKVEIRHHETDCTKIPAELWEEKPDVVINTSSEHFVDQSWLNFPKGICFYAQSTNMKHPTHVNTPSSLEDFKFRIGNVEKIERVEKMEFKYPNLTFDRYMISGIR